MLLPMQAYVSCHCHYMQPRCEQFHALVVTRVTFDAWQSVAFHDWGYILFGAVCLRRRTQHKTPQHAWNTAHIGNIWEMVY